MDIEFEGYDGTRVRLTEERMRHIVVRHPQLEDREWLIVEALVRPDEVYLSPAGEIHVLRKLVGDVSDYIIVIFCREDGKAYIKTAYYTSLRRKERRYRRFRRLGLS